jgi:hypothetical protein
MRTVRITLAAASLGLALAACGDTTGPLTGLGTATSVPAMSRGGDSGDHLRIRMKPGAPPLVANHTSFWAVQGKKTGAKLVQRGRSGYEGDEQPFLKFTVSQRAQLVDPSGHPLAPGDSILISIDAVPGELSARFSPEGLVFAGNKPAQLEFSYGNGDIEDLPAKLLAIWYVPCDGAPWEEQRSQTNRKDDAVVADISHFSNYAVAYRSR